MLLIYLIYYSLFVTETKYKSIHGKGLKMLTPKQMVHRLPVALAKVKAGNTSENLLDEIRKTIYSLYRVKELLKKCTRI